MYDSADQTAFNDYKNQLNKIYLYNLTSLAHSKK